MSSLLLSRRDWRMCSALLLAFCLAHIHELTNFHITIDDELVTIFSLSQTCLFADIGRWTHPIVSTLWPQQVVPAAPLLFFGIFLSISFIYMTRLVGVRHPDTAHVLIFSAFALHPIWMAQLTYAGNVLPVGVGVLAATAAAQLLAPAEPAQPQRLWARVTASTALVAVAVGAYQSLNIYFLVLAFAGTLTRVVRGAESWRTCARRLTVALLVCAAGSLLSLAAAWLAIRACGIHASAYAFTRFNPQMLLEQPGEMLRLVLRDAALSYGGYWKHFGYARAIFSAAVLLSAALCVWAAPAKKRPGVLLLVLLFMLLPSSFVLITGSPLLPRIYMASTAVLACLLLLAHAASPSRWAQRSALALAILAATQGLYVNAIHQARAWAVQQRDLYLAHEIYTSVKRMQQAEPNEENKRHILLNFHGSLPMDESFSRIWPKETFEVMGGSFFEWDGGNPVRIVSYMNLLGYTDVELFKEKHPGEFSPVYSAMPAWPAESSVRAYGDGYLIKLSSP